MSVNKYKPHLLVIPEDDANRQIANGFFLSPNLDDRVAQVLPNAGGWGNVVEEFARHVTGMRQFPLRRVVMLMDFDHDAGRGDYVRRQIPADLAQRVFILGMLSEPEQWRRSNPAETYEQLGMNLAKSCADGMPDAWGHALLIHNRTELVRLIADIKPFLFVSEY